MNFSDDSKVCSVIDKMKTAEITRASNRALIDDLYNGIAPYSAKEEQENKILVNVNWKQGTNILHQARAQYENAFLKPGNFWKITLPDCPSEHQTEWGSVLTQNINKPMKESPAYYQTLESMFAGICLHGTGIRMWWDDESWMSHLVARQDILMPTDTELTMTDLQYFAVRRKITPAYLFKKTFARDPKDRDRGWKLNTVRKLLDTYKDINTNPNNYDWANNPEQMAELYKQNLCYYDGDSAPVIWAWDFFYYDDSPKGCGWRRKIVLDKENTEVTNDKSDTTRLIYDSRKIYAKKLSHIIHFQFGDGNNVPPFKFHSIRSLGWLLFDVIQLFNRLDSQFTQHVFEQMLMMYRVNDPADRARLESIAITPTKGILPGGVEIVTADKRYAVDANIVQQLRTAFKQNIGESSSAYTQQADTGTQKERTKFEVEAILAQISALMGSMLTRAYRQEKFYALEVCRRFGLKKSMDFDVIRFREACRSAGVPEMWLDPDRWNVEIEQVLGQGNKMLELAQARGLREMRPDLDPDAQMEVDRIFIIALTDNPEMARRLVKDGRNKVTDARHDAQLAFGALMIGAPMEVKSGLNHYDQVEALLEGMASVIVRIQKTDNMGSPQDIFGLQNVARYIAKHIKIIAQNPMNKARVKDYTDSLSQAMNEVRAFAQRQQEAAEKAQQQQQLDPEVMAKIQTLIAQSKAKLSIDAAKSQQKLAQNNAKFRQSQAHAEAQHRNSMALETAEALSGLQLDEMTARGELAIDMEVASSRSESEPD